MAFDRQPFLQDDKVLIRPLHKDDFDTLQSVAADPLIWEQHDVKHRCTPKGFKMFFDQSIQSGGALVILDKKSSEIIGSSRYHILKEDLDKIEIGWTFISRKYWGRGYNGAIKKLMTDYAFQFVNYIVFFIHVGNIRSQKAVGKLGARKVLLEDAASNNLNTHRGLTFVLTN